MTRKRSINVDHLDTFVDAYVEAALWSTNDESDPETGGDPMDQNYGPGDIAPSTMESFTADCTDFLQKYGHLIEDDDSPAIKKWGRWELAGHDFWLTRNGHGAGFGDGNFPKHDDELYEAAKAYREIWLYVGDDGVIYASGTEPPRTEESRTVREGAPVLVTGALSPDAQLKHSDSFRGIQYEIYLDPAPPSRRAHGRRTGAHYAAVVYTPYESEKHGRGVEAEQIAFGHDEAEAVGYAEDYINSLLRPRGSRVREIVQGRR